MSTVPGGQGWWQASDGMWYPPESSSQPPGQDLYPARQLSPPTGPREQPGGSYRTSEIGVEPTLVTIGDIAVTQSTVITPSGMRPIGQVSWTFTDMSNTTQSIPTWAMVCAIVFFLFCLLGLLFLLVKETRTVGHVQVTVQGHGFVHTTQIPVTALSQVADINARVGYARSLSAAAQ